ncbi:hypothetical protein B0H16DRAFT_1484282 [Mycena metata]|uniref:Uncharacterized protein n=1 Tax=Mycena metata TaxID=1033252 RepID=A0AAD7GKC2_9AGAR|nr:hypothetical protein B0H16DRAFT_1484282 [Mycena metata]
MPETVECISSGLQAQNAFSAAKATGSPFNLEAIVVDATKREARATGAPAAAKQGLVYELDSRSTIKRGQKDNQSDVYPPALRTTASNPDPPSVNTLTLEAISYTNRALILNFGTLFFMSYTDSNPVLWCWGLHCHGAALYGRSITVPHSYEVFSNPSRAARFLLAFYSYIARAERDCLTRASVAFMAIQNTTKPTLADMIWRVPAASPRQNTIPPADLRHLIAEYFDQCWVQKDSEGSLVGLPWDKIVLEPASFYDTGKYSLPFPLRDPQTFTTFETLTIGDYLTATGSPGFEFKSGGKGQDSTPAPQSPPPPPPPINAHASFAAAPAPPPPPPLVIPTMWNLHPKVYLLPPSRQAQITPSHHHRHLPPKIGPVAGVKGREPGDGHASFQNSHCSGLCRGEGEKDHTGEQTEPPAPGKKKAKTAPKLYGCQVYLRGLRLIQ